MCSVNEDNEASIPAPVAPQISLKDALCRRCQVNKAQALLRKTDPYCCDCFMKYAIHKFRSTIGKARAIKPKENVLLAYSGGLSSGSMVEMVRKGLHDAGTLNKNLLIFKPTLLYIDEGRILNLSHEERVGNANRIAEFAKKCGFDIYTCGIELSLVSDPSQVTLQHNDYNIQTSPLSGQLQQLLDSVKCLTAKEDLLLRLKQRLIIMSAIQLKQHKIFLGPSATRLAGQLLTAVAQGRGAQISDEIGFSDCRNDVELLRPMREFVDKEVAYLAHFLNVPSVPIPTLSSKLSSKASIGRLTEEFVVKLQADFPGTISTLFRIGDKLKSNSSMIKEQEDALCLICHSKIEEAPPCSAYSARMISQSISRKGPNGMTDVTTLLNESTSCGKGNGCDSSLKTCCKTASAVPTAPEWDAALCYGCRVTLTYVKQPELMPASVQDGIHQRSRRQKMRESVEDFLL